MKPIHPATVAAFLAAASLLAGIHDAARDVSSPATKVVVSAVREPRPLTAEETAAGRRALQHKRAKLVAKSRQRFDQPDRAMEFFLEQRLAPGETELPLEHLRAEMTKLEAREAQQAAVRDARSLPGGIQPPGFRRSVRSRDPLWHENLDRWRTDTGRMSSSSR